MSISWDGKQRAKIEDAIRKYPIESGLCAALARVVYEVAKPGDEAAHGEQIRPKGGERFVVPKHTARPLWATHTLVCTREHRVDVLTGAGGCEKDKYLASHWEYVDRLDVRPVDVHEVDPGIQQL